MAVILQNATSEIFTKIFDELGDLPNEYLDFYKKINGIIFTGSDEFLFYLADIEDEICLEALFQIDSVNKNFDLLAIQQGIGDDLPTDLCIIGGDAGGNFYVLHRHTAQVGYWDRTCLYGDEDLKEDEIGKLYVLNLNFRELMTLILQFIADQKIEIIQNR